ncbi:MAG: glycoside hydrolase family 2 protein, partial [Agathobacter sp.]|nr:glycoside hydrolase family 2 protein [Agathobacter sp.]
MIRQQFNNNWIFKKQCEATGRGITLPHDAMLEEKRAQENATSSAGAYFATGIYEYEKELEVPAEWENKHVELQFEGVYKNSKVYVNGMEVGGAAYGYIPYFVNLDGKVNYGDKNTIKVVADNSDVPNSRWYTGAGVYRPVWIWVGEKTHI